MLLPPRSALFLPASNQRAIDKARTLPCDAVILDLEDAVAPEEKDRARRHAVSAVRQGGFGERLVVVRVNAVGTTEHVDDLAALRAVPAVTVLVPKVAGTADLAAARQMTDARLWSMIETCTVALRLGEIAAAASELGVEALVAGTNDLAKEMRCRPGIDRMPLMPVLSGIVMAARAAGIMALDGVSNVLDDPAALERECEQGRSLGFDGKTLIHPSQIEPANRAFSPCHAEIEWARQVVAAFAEPGNIGRGALRVDGAMVERLHHRRRRTDPRGCEAGNYSVLSAAMWVSTTGAILPAAALSGAEVPVAA